MPERTILNLSGDFRSRTCYVGVCRVHDVTTKYIMPVLKSTIALTKSERDKAIIGTYFLIDGCLETVTLMNRLSAAQGVGSAAKTLFELALELKLLCDDKTDGSAKKYFAYSKIERHKLSKRMLKFYSEKNLEPELPDRETLQSTIKPESYIQELISSHWPNLEIKNIRHWSGINDVKKRAEHLGVEYERLYWEIYSVMNWYDHPNPVSWVGVPPSKMHAGIQTAFISVLKLMTVILLTLKEEFRFDVVAQGFTRTLYELMLMPAEVMIQELERMNPGGSVIEGE